MFKGRVVGSVVSTIKYDTLTGVTLLVVEYDGANGKPKRLVAADATGQAGIGDLVYLTESTEAALVLRKGLVPCDASICGLVDKYNETPE